jgi:glutathione synthase/RimK-type ligase-like ATP-grasp enzyme
MQKNAHGRWKMTSMVARVGPANRFISNVASGGEIYKVTNVLRECAVRNPKKMRSLLVSVANKSCETIEEKYREQFGELGVDLGLTPNGQIYLLEINSKPSKTEDTLPLASNKVRPSVHRLLDYTQYLTYLSIK